ncbi:MAG: HAD family phosphatase [Anaerolineaceae bacterium]|nr:HAD family phosphatase [Anaerolineaceae bacterium]
MIKAVVLDIGGVLMRTEDPSGRRLLEKRYNLPDKSVDWLVFDSEEAAASTIGKVKAEEAWRSVQKKLDLSGEQMAEFIELFWAGDVFDQAAFDYLSSLSPEFITGILSNAWEGARDGFVQRYGMIEGQTVDHIMISCEEGVRKPDPEIYRRLKKTLGVEYDEILFVDDFIKNVEGAQALGIQAIHYRPGMNLINQIKSRLES